MLQKWIRPMGHQFVCVWSSLSAERNFSCPRYNTSRPWRSCLIARMACNIGQWLKVNQDVCEEEKSRPNRLRSDFTLLRSTAWCDGTLLKLDFVCKIRLSWSCLRRSFAMRDFDFTFYQGGASKSGNWSTNTWGWAMIGQPTYAGGVSIAHRMTSFEAFHAVSQNIILYTTVVYRSTS